MSKQQLAVVEQREVSFYDDTIVAVQTADGSVYVPIRPICDNLGVTLQGQRERINRDPVLSELASSVSVTLTQQAREMICLPLKYVPGWLFGINANRVKDSVRDQLIRYQKECYDVLSEAFASGRLTYHDEIMGAESPAARAYQIAMALADLARQQYVMESRLESAEKQLDEHTQRIESLETQIGNVDRFISAEQASQISEAVKLIAGILGQASGRNEYGGVYMELYRRFGITSYKQLPAAKFEQAISFLRQWYQQVSDTDAAPF